MFHSETKGFMAIPLVVTVTFQFNFFLYSCLHPVKHIEERVWDQIQKAANKRKERNDEEREDAWIDWPLHPAD